MPSLLREVKVRDEEPRVHPDHPAPTRTARLHRDSLALPENFQKVRGTFGRDLLVLLHRRVALVLQPLDPVQVLLGHRQHLDRHLKLFSDALIQRSCFGRWRSQVERWFIRGTSRRPCSCWVPYSSRWTEWSTYRLPSTSITCFTLSVPSFSRREAPRCSHQRVNNTTSACCHCRCWGLACRERTL